MPASSLRCTRADRARERHRPEETVLHQVVREHWPAFRERAEEQGGLPGFVVRDFEEYLRCGLPEHGLCHLACASCGHSVVVAFSCKRRGFCPSCCARRMADVAAHLARRSTGHTLWIAPSCTTGVEAETPFAGTPVIEVALMARRLARAPWVGTGEAWASEGLGASGFITSSLTPLIAP